MLNWLYINITLQVKHRIAYPLAISWVLRWPCPRPRTASASSRRCCRIRESGRKNQIWRCLRAGNRTRLTARRVRRRRGRPLIHGHSVPSWCRERKTKPRYWYLDRTDLPLWCSVYKCVLPSWSVISVINVLLLSPPTWMHTIRRFGVCRSV